MFLDEEKNHLSIHQLSLDPSFCEPALHFNIPVLSGGKVVHLASTLKFLSLAHHSDRLVIEFLS